MEYAKLVMLLTVRNVWMKIHLNVKSVLVHTCWIIATVVFVLKEIEHQESWMNSSNVKLVDYEMRIIIN